MPCYAMPCSVILCYTGLIQYIKGRYVQKKFDFNEKSSNFYSLFYLVQNLLNISFVVFILTYNFFIVLKLANSKSRCIFNS